MPEQIRYVETADGIRIAYRAVGEGQCIVSMPGLLSNAPLEHSSELFTEQRFVEQFRSIRYDSRGQGLSDQTVIDLSMEAMETDLMAVIDALEISQFVLYARFYSGPAAIAFAVHHPEMVSHLILHNTWARASEYFQSPLIQALVPLAAQDWELFSMVITQARYRWQRGDMATRRAKLFAESMRPEFFLQLEANHSKFDATKLLDDVTSPTLVVHRTASSMLDPVSSSYLASHIPRAQLVILHPTGGSMAEEIDRSFQEVVRFLSPVAHYPNGEATNEGSQRISLTTRELQVLQLLASGRHNHQVARELDIGVQTVERHIANIYLKLDVHSRVEAATLAIRKGLVH